MPRPDSLMSKRASTSRKQVESVPIGRIGAMAAKQVILQKIRDAEREMLLNDFMSRGDKISWARSSAWTRATSLSSRGVSKAACDAAR
jgi:hypothetical protein